MSNMREIEDPVRTVSRHLEFEVTNNKVIGTVKSNSPYNMCGFRSFAYTSNKAGSIEAAKTSVCMEFHLRGFVIKPGQLTFDMVW